MNSSKPYRVCSVCGDKAIAQNFNAITCESCKHFFRRNAEKISRFKCKNDDRCEVNIITRKKCRKCRLLKCFAIGMRKEGIWTEVQKQQRYQKIEENRKQRPQNIAKNRPSSESNDSNNDNNLDLSLTNFSNVNSDNELNVSFDEIKDLIPFKRNMTEENLNIFRIESNVQYYRELVPISRPLTDYDNTFNEMESTRFKELIEASKFLTIKGMNINFPITTATEAMRVISMKWDRDIRNIIKAAKSLSAFKNMCEDDQLTLLKYGSGEITFMRSISCYVKEADCWAIVSENDNSIKTLLNLEVFKQKSMDTYLHFKMFLNKLAQEWQTDPVILHLLLTIILFNPNRPQLIHKHMIRLQQQVYMHLLKRYLHLRYRSESEVKSKFSRFIEILCDLHDIHESHIRPDFERSPETSYAFLFESPLLREIYDN